MSTAADKSNWKLCEFAAHTSNVNCLALSPTNGRTLVTGGDDRRVNLWIVGQPNCLMSISGITSPVQSVSFNYSENWVGAGSKSGVIKVFDLDENKTVRSISGHKAAITCLDFHRYGDILGSGSMDTNVKLWDVRRKGCIFTYKGHQDVVHAIQFSPDGKWIVSASEDGTAKLWDLSAGRLVKEFRSHAAGVTSVQFHPKEFLLVTGSSDRSAIVWDLERLEPLSICGPESTAVRSVQFDSEGTVLLTGAQDSLRTYSWESAKAEDKLPVHWGKVADMAISGEQLIGASFVQAIVSLWCIDIKRLRPFSGDPASPIEMASQVIPTSGRQQFEYQKEEVKMKRPFTQASGSRNVCVCKPLPEEGEEGEGGGVERGTREVDSPPVEIEAEERVEIFAARQKLMRTPPKNKTFSPFHPPPISSSSSSVGGAPGAGVPPLPPSQFNSVVRIGDGGQGEGRRGGGGGGGGGVRKKRDPRRKKGGAWNNLIEDFAPKSKPPVKPQVHHVPAHPHYSTPSLEKMLEREIRTNHTDVCSILENRLHSMRDVRSQWSNTSPRVSLEAAINSGNQSVIVDLLNVLLLKRTLWNLDMAVLVLPEVKILLRGKYESYARCGCEVVKLVLKSFGPVIKTNLTTPPGAQGGVDISKEERYEKCQTCYSHLVVLREDLEKVSRESGTPAAGAIRETALLDCFSVLD